MIFYPIVWTLNRAERHKLVLALYACGYCRAGYPDPEDGAAAVAEYAMNHERCMVFVEADGGIYLFIRVNSLVGRAENLVFMNSPAHMLDHLRLKHLTRPSHA